MLVVEKGGKTNFIVVEMVECWQQKKMVNQSDYVSTTYSQPLQQL